MYQSTVRVHVADRYKAHVELDRLYKDRSREDRGWHHAIVDAGPAGFWALLRTEYLELVQASPAPEAWGSRPLTAPGENVEFLIQYTPKKAKLFSRFFEDDGYAIDQVRTRIDPMLEAPVLELIGRQHIGISKRTNAYHAPSAFVRVTGQVRDPAAYDKFLCTGIGGSRAFGVGLAITPDTALYLLAVAIAESETMA